MKPVLPYIVIAQFLCTSLWFAGNAVISDIVTTLHLDAHFLAHLTSAIQFGFIAGTLTFAIFSIADRYSPSKVFFYCSILAGVFNLGILIPGIHATQILAVRFLTGFFLAGIYPVGMKIASDYYKAGLGKSLGYLVGALVLGTAFPHLLKNWTNDFPWTYVILSTSFLSIIGGLCIRLFVPDGPFRTVGQRFDIAAFGKGFIKKEFRAVSIGYFGHMWELYAFWAFVPVMLMAYQMHFPSVSMNIPLLSFFIIASGGPACILGGILSQYFGARRIATIALCTSCLCCLLSPLFLFTDTPLLFIFFLFAWAIAVIADSPLFSSLVAQNAPDESRGSSLTIVNCIGFSITIISIQLISSLAGQIGARYVYMILAIGPILGLIALINGSKRNSGYPVS